MIALIDTMITDEHAVDSVNALLHVYRGAILGRMGLPLREHGVNVICTVLDAEPNEINALTGKLGSIPGVQSKTIYRQK